MSMDAAMTGCRRKPLAAAIAVALLAPGIALAEPLFQVPLYGNDADLSRWDTNYVEFGVGYNSVTGDGYKFGQYTGLYKTDAFGIANLNYSKGDASTGDYTNLWGLNLGLPSRQVGGGIGTQGRWNLNAEFDQITNYQTDSASFIFNGLGSNKQTQSPGYTGITAGSQQPPANAAAILPFEQSGFGIKTDRNFFTVNGSYTLGTGWELTGMYNYQTRDGTKLTGAAFGNSGGNPRAVIIPYPIDDNTNQFEVALKYASEQTQFSVSYWYSKYSNNVNSLTWQNPYALVSGWQAGSGVGFPTGFGSMSLEPNNDFQQIKANFGYNFSATTRLVATFQYGESKQNQSFLPYTIDTPPLVTPGLAAPVPLPASSANGKIDDTLFDVALTMRPVDKVFLKIAYHYDDRDNKTPEQQFLYVPGDSLNQTVVPPGMMPNGVNSGFIRTNLPPGTTINKFTVDGDYNLGRGTALRVWYQYLKTDYKEASQELRANSDVNEVGVELKSRANEVVNGDIKYVWDQRRGADFTSVAPYAATVTPPTLAATTFSELPTLRQFYVANYNQNQVKAQVNITPASPFSAQLLANWTQRTYQGPDCGGPNDQLLLTQAPPFTFPSECQGLSKSTSQVYTLDGQYAASGGWNLYAFYTWSQLSQNQAGRSYSDDVTAVSTAQNWNASPKSTDNTFGIGAVWKPSDKPYDGGIQYLYNQGTTAISTAAGPALTAPTGIPNAKTTLNSLQIFGKWQYSKNIMLRANYWYQRYRTSDWAYDNATPVSSNNVLLTGQSSPNYTANVVGFSVSYTGW